MEPTNGFEPIMSFDGTLQKCCNARLCEVGLKKNIHNYDLILYFVKLKLCDGASFHALLWEPSPPPPCLWVHR